jgi:hypothetical protein
MVAGQNPTYSQSFQFSLKAEGILDSVGTVVLPSSTCCRFVESMQGRIVDARARVPP